MTHAVLYYQWVIAGLAVMSLIIIVVTVLVQRVRRQRETALLAERDELRAYFVSSPTGTVVLDKNRHIVRLNSAAASLAFGKGPLLVGQRFGVTFGCTNRALDKRGCGHSAPCSFCPMRKVIDQVIAEGQPAYGVEMPMVIGREGGLQTVWLRVGAEPVTVGGTLHVVVTLEDISESKLALEKMQQSAAELERVSKETHKASQTKGQFLANMSHEIRTPLNGVIGMTELLVHTDLNEEQLEYAQTIQTSAKALLVVVNDVLDFSKIEAEKMILEKSSFDLRQCLDDALRLVAPNAVKKKLKLECQIDPAVQTHWIGDAGRLCQILANLVGNAIKFTERGEVVVSVSGMPQGGRRFMLEFSVRDTGVGIPVNDQERLFQSFSQVDASTTRRFSGTGLGLAISKRLCEMMGGAMSMESSGVPGKGSTFRFSILVQGDVHARVLPNGEPSHVLEGKRVLIVDAHSLSREQLSEKVLQWNMVPVTALSGTAALGLLKGREPLDVAIFDSEMPDSSGVDLADLIGRLPNRAGLPIILLTPSNGFGVGSDGRHVNICLAKPVGSAQLRDALISTLTPRSVQEEPAIRPAAMAKPLADKMAGTFPLRILLVEDNVVNQKVAVLTLNKLGYNVDVARDGSEALEAVKRTRYDVVFMDIQMPIMDGEQATIRIRKELPAERQPRIIAMTAHALKGDRERYLAAGMDDYLSKPVRTERLIEVLRSSNPLPADTAGRVGTLSLKPEDQLPRS